MRYALRKKRVNRVVGAAGRDEVAARGDAVMPRNGVGRSMPVGLLGAERRADVPSW